MKFITGDFENIFFLVNYNEQAVSVDKVLYKLSDLHVRCVIWSSTTMIAKCSL